MFDEGVYTLAEVAQYTGVNAKTLQAWFMPRPDGKGAGPVFQSDFARMKNDYAVSFLNLIEAYVASFFRKNHVKLADIRRTHTILKSMLGVDHPFAHADLSVGVGKIVLEKAGNERFVEVISRQLTFPEFADGLRRLNYNIKTKLAEHWEIADGISVSPRVGFGKPVIEQTGVSTLIIANQYLANGKDAALVARLFRIPKDGVEKAFRFEERLGRIAA